MTACKSSKYRLALAKYENTYNYFECKFVRYSPKKNYDGTYNVLFVDIIHSRTGEYLADHVWVRCKPNLLWYLKTLSKKSKHRYLKVKGVVVKYHSNQCVSNDHNYKLSNLSRIKLVS